MCDIVEEYAEKRAKEAAKKAAKEAIVKMIRRDYLTEDILEIYSDFTYDDIEKLREEMCVTN